MNKPRMTFGQSLRRRLTRWIEADATPGRPALARGARDGGAGSPHRGRLLLETLERRQLMAGDVELLATEGLTDPPPQPVAMSVSTNAVAPQGEPGQDLVQFAKDLSAAGVTFYGANWCPACTQQKELFEDGGDDLPFVEVTLPDRTQDPAFDSLQISQYPTWVFPDDTRLTGVLSLETISQESGVPIPTNADERPTFEEIGPQTVMFGSPLHIPVDGYDPEGGPLTVTVSVADPSLLEATVLTGNRSVRLDMQGFGDMVFELFEDRAPTAAGRVATLAAEGFYDGIIFHRVVDGFVLQAGDPTGTGTSGSNLGPFDDEFHPDLQHSGTGVLSFAKSADDTNNSQFFITEVATPHLDFNHSVFGQLTEGEDVREAISRMEVNNPTQSRPTTDIVIDNATVFTDTENSVVMLKALAASGSTSVTFTITDSDGNSYQEVVPVNLAPDTRNAQPYLDPVATPAAVTTGNDATLQLSSVDLEQDPVRYLASTSSPNVTAIVDATTGLVTVTPVNDYVGTADVIVGVQAASNAGNNFDSQTVRFTFDAAATVAAPTAIDLAAASDSGASDSDNVTNVSSLTFDISGVTDGATVQIVNTANNSVVGEGTAQGTSISITTNNLAAIGDGTYSLAARQVVGGTASALSPAIQMTLDRSLPTINRNSFATTANVSTLFQSDVSGSEEGSGGVYDLTEMPTGATIDPGTGVVQWTPTAAQEGTNDFTLRLTDLAGNVRSESFTVTVAGEPLAGIRLELTDANGDPLTSIAVGETFQLRMIATDNRSLVEQGGIFAAYADVVFDGNLVRAVPGTEITYGTGFGTLRRGTIDSGVIDEVGAVHTLLSPTFEAESLIATVQMEALASGTVNFVSNAADNPANEVLLYLSNDRVPAESVQYGNAALSIGQSFTALPDTFTFDNQPTARVLDVLANDTVTSGSGTLSVISFNGPTDGSGQVTLDNGVLRFTPTDEFVGTAEFSYVVSDSNGAQETVPVTITLTDDNDPPVGADDSFTVESGSGETVLDVLANEADTADEGETLEVTAVSTPSAGGTATVTSGGGSVTYTPPASFVGTETFTYTLSDGTSTDTVSVTVTVTSPDNPPTANDDTFPASGQILEDAAEASYDVLANDTTDVDNQTFVIDSVGQPSDGGTVTIGNNGSTLLYTPAANFNGTETVTYTIRDTGGGLSTATATFNVTAVDDLPPVQDAVVQTIRNASDVLVLSIADLLAAQPNPDSGETLTFVNASTPAEGGTVTISNNGQEIRYTPATDFTGEETFTFQVEDSSGSVSAAATATITVNAFSRRNVAVRFNAGGSLPTSALKHLTLTGTNLLGEQIDVSLSDPNSATRDENGWSIPDLLPGSYSLNVPAIPFFQGSEQARTIPIESLPEEGGEEVPLEVGRLLSEWITPSSFVSSAARETITAVIDGDGNVLLSQSSPLAESRFNDLQVTVSNGGATLTVAGDLVETDGSTTAVSKSVNVSSTAIVRMHGEIGQTRMYVIDVSDDGLELSAATATTSSASAATASTAAAGTGTADTSTADTSTADTSTADTGTAGETTSGETTSGGTTTAGTQSDAPAPAGEPISVATTDLRVSMDSGDQETGQDSSPASAASLAVNSLGSATPFSAATAGVTSADVFVPAFSPEGMNGGIESGDGNGPAGEPVSEVLSDSTPSTSGSSGSIDAAMTSVTASLQRISPAGDVVAEGSSEDAETFRRAVDEVLTADLPAS